MRAVCFTHLAHPHCTTVLWIYCISFADWELHSPGLLRGGYWQFLTDVSEQPIGHIFKGQKSFDVCYSRVMYFAKITQRR